MTSVKRHLKAFMRRKCVQRKESLAEGSLRHDQAFGRKLVGNQNINPLPPQRSQNGFTFPPVWSYVVAAALGAVQGRLFMRDRPLSSFERRRASSTSKADRSVYDRSIRVEESVSKKDIAESDAMTLVLAILLMVIYIPLRFWILIGLAVVTGLSVGFSLVVCYVLVKRSNWPGQYTPTFHKITLQESARADFERLDWH
jgi:hypothetical protein